MQSPVPIERRKQLNKMRQLRLRMADDTVRSVTVDENQPVANLMVIICTKLGQFTSTYFETLPRDITQ